MKFWQRYYQPTPAKWQKIGLACKAIAGMGVPAAMTGMVWVGAGLFLVGIAGEFLTNFFVETPTDEKK